MATKIWEPKAPAVAQVGTIQLTTYDAAGTYKLTVGGIDIVSEAADTDANTTASNMASAWNNSTHPYANRITAAATTDTITFTADVAEEPFTIVPSASGGSAAIGAYSATTAPSGPHTLDDAQNWSGEALPVNNDILVFENSNSNVCWGLEGLSTTGHNVEIRQSYTGLIGLEPLALATTADGATTVNTAPEYRPVSMQLDMARIDIGEHLGSGNTGGARRINLDNDRAGASDLIVHTSARNGFVTGRPPIQYLAAHANADIDVRDGRIGIGTLTPGDTGTVGDIVINGGECFLGEGMTLSNYTQRADVVAQLRLEQATLTKATVYGGRLTLAGDQAVTAIEARGGTVMPTTTGTIALVDHYAGLVDYTKSNQARTVTSHKLYRGEGARVLYDPDIVTLTLAQDGGGLVDIARA